VSELDFPVLGQFPRSFQILKFQKQRARPLIADLKKGLRVKRWQVARLSKPISTSTGSRFYIQVTLIALEPLQPHEDEFATYSLFSENAGRLSLTNAISVHFAATRS
jgi:hypothetical protein